MTVSLIASEKFKDHITGSGFPESPDRLDSILNYLISSDLLSKLDVVEPHRKDKEYCKLVHDDEYISRVREACELGAPIVDTADNPISKDSYDTALLAAGAMTEAVDKVFSNDDTERVMVLPRPPGHHAEKQMAIGFCLFNNVAIAARYAQQNYAVEKVAIIDFDVHHGNGTQHIFEEDPTVLYASTHQFPFYPGTGAKDEIGIGAGKGTTVNFPMNIDDGDDELIDIFNNSLSDKLITFNPDLMLLSAGFDAHKYDPIGGLTVTTKGFYDVSNILVDIANEVCDGKIVSALEGGYNLKALSESVAAHILALKGDSL